MPEEIIECVPNFSEGRNRKIIEKIAHTIDSVRNVKLLHVDPGYDANRTVMTFIGNAGGVEEAAFCAVKEAAKWIDMRAHSGIHPRIGATDILPFIPLSGVSLKKCIEISRSVAKRVGEELKIPVYLYEKSASKPERIDLGVIRKGGYETIKEKIRKPEWKPDFGPVECNVRSGATVMGVRDILIAFNINLNTNNAEYTKDIAMEIREKGRSVRKGNITPFYYKGEKIIKYKPGEFPCGSCGFIGKTVKDTRKHCKKYHNYDLVHLLKMNGVDAERPEGRGVKKPGLLKKCKAIGWYVPEYDRAQVSVNLTDYKITPLHLVMEIVRSLAEERNLEVSGSEIIGMVPLDALLYSGQYYLGQKDKTGKHSDDEKVKTAVESLGLHDVRTFDIRKQVLDIEKLSS